MRLAAQRGQDVGGGLGTGRAWPPDGGAAAARAREVLGVKVLASLIGTVTGLSTRASLRRASKSLAQAMEPICGLCSGIHQAEVPPHSLCTLDPLSFASELSQAVRYSRSYGGRRGTDRVALAA